MSTPAHLIQLAVNSGREIDRLFPGLREKDNEQWMQKVVYLASLADPSAGRKARSAGARLSPDTLGFKTNDQGHFYAVSIIRDNPPINEWRNTPLDYGLVTDQYWEKQEPVDIGGVVQPPPPDNELKKLVLDIAQQCAVIADAVYAIQKKLGQVAGKL